MLEWMAWTTPTAIFFVVIVLMLISMTVWELVSPNVPRKGFLPMVTTRGDRLFIGLVGAAYIHLAWLYFSPTGIWGAFAIAAVWLLVAMKWG